MNSRNTPDVPIHKAISASVAIPFVFEPIVIGDEIFCDGGLLNNLPIETLLTDTSLFEDENKIEHIDAQKENKDENKDEEKIDNNTKDNAKDNTKDNAKDNTKDNTKEKDAEKEDNSNTYSSILGVYLLAKNNIVNRDNYQTISLSNYMNMMIHTLSSEYINNKIQYSNLNNLNNKNKKYKIIVFNIPCDIMSFLKLNATTSSLK